MTIYRKLSSYWRQLQTWLRAGSWSAPLPAEELPLRSELFSVEQMAQHGKGLAASHRLATGHMPDQLLLRLMDNESALVEVCKLLTAAVSGKRRISPAGEWLLDNFYLIEEQIRTARRHLPKGYSRELPRLDQASAGRPRVYDIALEAVAHGDGRVDSESLVRFVAAYQTVSDLTLGELWAIPIMLRLAVIENLRRVGMRISAGWAERNLADAWADQMIETADKEPKGLILIIADMARSNPPMSSAFVAELARRLQGRGPALALPLTWIEQHLCEAGLTIEHLVHSENQQQAADQVSVSNSIGSLRVLSAMDWREFVETLSIVEQTLLEDPDGTYARMDFATRDHYRHATEKIARKGCLSEGEVARQAVELACAETLPTADDSALARRGHVGFYLIDRGLPLLERLAKVRLGARETLRRVAGRCPLFLYLGAIALLSLGIGGGLLALAALGGWSGGELAGFGVLSLLAASQLAVAMANRLSTLLVAPQALPRMDFSTGIPAASRSLVVVPTMLSHAAAVEDLIEALEVRFLANRDPHLHFGLLTDFTDAAQAELPSDRLLEQLARSRIEALNEKYGGSDGRAGGDIFYLFHRARQWNPQEGVWMGFERKRGKLAALNALLRGAGNDFSLLVGDPAILREVRYVITLDTDTQLPRDAARLLVAAMAHPLNRPHYDAAKRRITEGYGILQPCVAISLPGTSRSHYARLYGGEPGIDPYTRAVSNVYQDVFGEGSFIGKGIYDVDAFEQSLAGRFPDNRILSHDLLEGCYARAGLLSDVHVYEDYPARYEADVNRRYRWIRGDWQLAAWLLRRVPCQCAEGTIKEGAGPHRQRNPLSHLSQWKLIDNLRRSLVPAALLLLLLLGWTLLPQVGGWTLALLALLCIAPLSASLFDVLHKADETLWRQHFAAVGHSALRRFSQVAFELACLPYEAWFSLDAIGRTLWRMLVSRRSLLEWNPSSEVDRALAQRGRNKLLGSYRSMWIAPAIATAQAIYLLLTASPLLPLAAPILLLWLLAPAIAWWIGRPLVPRQAALSGEQLIFLRTLARRTWAFFDKFVGPEDHWLPPDNYQEYRVAAIAHRTSPTNMGLSLLANLAAYDFGYLPAGELLERTANSLRSMDGLERHRGHFYNWYDTQTLQALPPLYVSTVDSGNLAGHLLTLRAGLLEVADDSIFPLRLFAGFNDTFRVLHEVEDASDKAVMGLLAEFHKKLGVHAALPPSTLAAVHGSLEILAEAAAKLLVRIAGSTEEEGEASLASKGNGPAAAWDAGWAQALARQCRTALDELSFLAPWLLLPPAPPGLEVCFSGQANICSIPTLRGLAQLDVLLCPDIVRRLNAVTTPAERERTHAQRAWLVDLQQAIKAGSARARERLTTIDSLAQQAGALADMDYGFLFDKPRQLMIIGYNVQEHRADSSYYDLLASEARLANFVAIAQGQLPQDSWFALGRLLTATGGEPVLLSWSGSMFEYLMPQLIMPTFAHTLLDQTCQAAVARQIEYGRQRGVPWGISESGYNTVDVHLNYQYRAFGVPGLGLKRGLAEDLVIAPYASALALMVAPEEACLNLQRLAADGNLGQLGFFEAIDYTPARQRRGQDSVVVHSYMAHHQGMSLLAMAYLLLGQPMQRRFCADRLFQAVMLLLQERVPKATALFSHTAQLAEAPSTPEVAETPIRVLANPDTPIPEVQLLSNGRYHVMVTNAGGGYSRWKDLAVSRWREDSTCDNWGSFCYIRETTPGAKGAFWSSAHQPSLKVADSYEAIFSEGRAEFRRCDAVGSGSGKFETHTEIVVSPEDDIELRRVRITNRSAQRRQIEVTSYVEVVIAPVAADALHPAFSNLFVQTEIVHPRHAILCTRRPRSADEPTPWMFHLVAAHGSGIGEVSYETDRQRFIGRGRTVADPQAMQEPAQLSGSDGSVLDPMVAIRYSLTLEPEQSATIDMVTGMGESREQALSLIDKYQDRHLADRVFDLTWSHSQVVLRQLNASEADAQLYARLASSIIYANASLRADPALLSKNRRGQFGLWGYAISGDVPIVLVQIGDAANIDLVRQLVQAHAYWRLKGLVVDLVIWNEDHAGYRQRLQEQIIGLIALGIEASAIDRPGGIFVRSAEQISNEDRILFQSVARAVISDSRGTLAEQLEHRVLAEARGVRFTPSRPRRAEAFADVLPASLVATDRALILSNGLGGFAPDGREYVITLAPGQTTPAPWVNVLANPNFGSIVSESGSAYTWHDNAHEFRLSPWHNDPVCDGGGEAIYLRDEESGQFWSPTPAPVRMAVPYVIRHGFGYSVYESCVDGICCELWVYVAIDAAVKFSLLKVRNTSGRPRKLSATGYVEWVLGDLHAKTAMHVCTEIAPRSGAIYARNPYNTEFSEQVAFFDVDEPVRSLTADRSEFLGRNGSLRNPAAMHRARLSGKVGAGLDPCAAIQLSFDLADGQEHEVVFRLGVGRNVDAAGQLVQRYRGPQAGREALTAVRRHWQQTLGKVQVATPDPAVNVLANGWLVYQTLACRVWARSGFYQSGGAFGFRDQLQDTMALIHSEPALLRQHLLLCASRQFPQGDVQHWWHQPSGRGVRTHCSDDFLWLPLAVCRYVHSTGDSAVLLEPVSFLDGRPINPDEDSYYDLPGRSGEVASLYQHCLRAIKRSLSFGEHGLPLMGSGDWNDGMNRVGVHGRGESVWLGFFLCAVLRQFAPLAAGQGDSPFAERCLEEETRLRENLETHGWDGQWYRRAYFDDGTPLGSADNTECRIDSIPQSWSVLSLAVSGAASPERARLAMHAVDQLLVRPEQGLIQLLDPPFDKSSLDPGYIRGYVPGVRENGGQYTHGAIWAAMAFAALGEGERAWELQRMINPVNHASSAAGMAIYQVEPYVMAGDVYAGAPHSGRGGWSWYTGAAGWMYRLLVESLLGLRREGDLLHLMPSLPADWPEFSIDYRHGQSVYRIKVSNSAESRMLLDGVEQPEPAILLVDDAEEHAVELWLAGKVST